MNHVEKFQYPFPVSEAPCFSSNRFKTSSTSACAAGSPKRKTFWMESLIVVKVCLESFHGNSLFTKRRIIENMADA